MPARAYMLAALISVMPLLVLGLWIELSPSTGRTIQSHFRWRRVSGAILLVYLAVLLFCFALWLPIPRADNTTEPEKISTNHQEKA